MSKASPLYNSFFSMRGVMESLQTKEKFLKKVKLITVVFEKRIEKRKENFLNLY